LGEATSTRKSNDKIFSAICEQVENFKGKAKGKTTRRRKSGNIPVPGGVLFYSCAKHKKKKKKETPKNNRGSAGDTIVEGILPGV